MFNLVNAMFFLAVLPYLVKVATKLTPQKPEKMAFDELHHVKFLDSKYVDIPSVALAQARAEIVRMGKAVQVMYDDVIQSIKDKKLKELSKWRKREDAIDILQREITQFLVRVIQENVVLEESKEVAELMRMTNNLESIGDAIENIAQLGEQLVEEKLDFSEAAWKDYDLISKEARRFIRFVVRAVRNDDKNIMPESQEMEDRIDQLTEEMRENHFSRLQDGVCTVDRGLILVDMVTAFEKMGDFCYNIAQAVVGIK
jgi:phosphate:Na+ symporter